MQVLYTSAADRDVKRALDYYKAAAGVKVAENLIDQLELKIAKILKNPRSYKIVTKDFRCANLDRFPYQIVYRVASASIIRIISVRHHRQHPDFGLNR